MKSDLLYVPESFCCSGIYMFLKPSEFQYFEPLTVLSFYLSLPNMIFILIATKMKKINTDESSHTYGGDGRECPATQ
jgi:hypothetical protein